MATAHWAAVFKIKKKLAIEPVSKVCNFLKQAAKNLISLRFLQGISEGVSKLV